MVTSTKDNELYYLSGQIERAKKARDLHHLLGAPSTRDLKARITQNLIKDGDRRRRISHSNLK